MFRQFHVIRKLVVRLRTHRLAGFLIFICDQRGNVFLHPRTHEVDDLLWARQIDLNTYPGGCVLMIVYYVIT